METTTSKKEDILQAALLLFAKRGFDATTIPMIAKEASVGAGTIYRYFENKDTLVNELFRFYVERYIIVLKEEYALREGTIRQRFHHLFHGMVRFSSENEHALYFIKTHSHSHVLSQESKNTFEELIQLIREFIEQGQVQGIIRQLPVNALIAIVLGAFMELHQLVRVGDIEYSSDLLEGVESSCWDAIRAQ
ncbi:TetR/AcrR family transcriptional regulator [Pontibacillus salicampi]|uniref:TetR/AcrR family transcriptional regulator n=1 Tax=Pontibacillus salicampi TaxID=1449801 RepID=A0ABV6LQC4_9BACI